jgi:conflict system STAND superfamily ATPase
LPVSDVLRPDCRLHTLGWSAFQDLTLTVLRQVLGQTVEHFAQTNDGGRDGAFLGNWKPATGCGTDAVEALEGPFVVQCKSVQAESATLVPSNIKAELSKVRELVDAGQCSVYILATNATVTGLTAGKIRQAAMAAGAQHVVVLEKTWFNAQIAENPTLRRHVPRLYGLGDLSQILDQRRYDQTGQLLSHLATDLAAFVPTKAYDLSLKMLLDENVVLVLGEPATGKSTVAAALATQAADSLGYGVVRIDNAAEFAAAWNPHEPNQLFWIDDAFGRHRYDEGRAEDWARRFDLVEAALSSGARFIFTSRDYIFRRAEKHLIGISNQLRQNVVQVRPDDLSLLERQKILYNQLRYGDQPQSFLKAIKLQLGGIAASESFTPELARRLGSEIFTAKLDPTDEHSCGDFLERPLPFLLDVFGSLDDDSTSALALIYLEDDGLTAPMELSPLQESALAMLGGTKAGVRRALQSLNGTFVRMVSGATRPRWHFLQPTLAEAFAAYVGQDVALLDVFIAGLTAEIIQRLVDCGDTPEPSSGLVFVPEYRHEAVAAVFPGKNYDSSHHSMSYYVEFCAERCSDSFLQRLAEQHRDFMDKVSAVAQVDMTLPSLSEEVSSSLVLIDRLHQLGMLAPEQRDFVAERIVRSSIAECDPRWINSGEIARILTSAEVDEIRAGVRESGVESIERKRSYVRDEDYSLVDAEIDRDLELLLNTIRLYEALWPDDENWREELLAVEDEVSISFIRGGYGYCDWPDPEEWALREGDLMIFADIDELAGQGERNRRTVTDDL